MTETSDPILAPDRKVTANATPASDRLRHERTRDEIAPLFEPPFDERLFQALYSLGGANSIFVGDTLLTTRNPEAEHDRQLFERPDMSPFTSDG